MLARHRNFAQTLNLARNSIFIPSPMISEVAFGPNLMILEIWSGPKIGVWPRFQAPRLGPEVRPTNRLANRRPSAWPKTG